MKKLIIALLLVATSAFGAGFLQYDASQQTKIQGFAPNGLAVAVLTVYGTVFDMSNYLAFSVYAPADYKINFMDTSSVTGHLSEPGLGGQWSTFVVNKATPFIRITGATNGVLRRM